MNQSSYQYLPAASLQAFNTFGMDVTAEALITVEHVQQLAAIAEDARLPKPIRVLGSGSNVLLSANVSGTILLNRMRGISIIREDAQHVWIRAAAGELWHDLVLYAIGNGWGGIENLALIPGTVGASPIQNIGAYGVEVKDSIEEVEVWDWALRGLVRFTNANCQFGYRDSIFKHELSGKVVVTAVSFRLQKHPQLRMSYGAIRDELAAIGAVPSPQSIAQAVINIRRSKLPDPAQIGNAGSFFKNPSITQDQFDVLRMQHPDLPAYPAPAGLVKVPAGWLIEACGLKGHRIGDAGIHAKQALVLVNYGSATGHEIWALSEVVLHAVKGRFGIELEREVQVW